MHSSVLQEIRPAPPSTNDGPRKSGIFFNFFKIINNDVWYISIRQWVRNPCPKVRQGQSRMSENESQLTKNKLLSGAR